MSPAKKTINICALITPFVVSSFHSLSAQTILAHDDFSSGGLSGGTGWEDGSSWSAGTVTDGELVFDRQSGNDHTTRIFNLEIGNDPGVKDAYWGSYRIQYDLSYSNSSADMNQIGFRVFQGQGTGGSVYLGEWTGQHEGGQLHFYSGGNRTQLDASNQSVWNLFDEANSHENGVSYQFFYDVDVFRGNNAGDAYGTYDVRVARYENGVLTNSASLNGLDYRNSNQNPISGNVMNSLTFQVTNSKTTLFIDNIMITSGEGLDVIPEVSSSALTIIGLTGMLVSRKRCLISKYDS